MQFKNGQYEIQGVKLLDIANEFGTPLYVYNGQRIIDQCGKLRAAFGDLAIKIKYAGKALTNVNILRVVKSAGAGFDAVSIHEVRTALHAGFLPEEIIFTPNCVDFAEIEEAIEIGGITLNIDSIPYLEKIGKKYGKKQPVCIRVNPHITAGGNANIQVGHAKSKFGVSIDFFDKAKAVIDKYGIPVIGLHVHTGSDITDVDVFIQSSSVLFDLASQFPDLKFLDFGSGFKVPYKSGDKATNITQLGHKMQQIIPQFFKKYGRELEIWFEPGKFLVSESGHFLVKTTLIKEVPGMTFLGVNSGFNHLIRPMFYDSFHDIINISNPKGTMKTYSVVGNICETDTFATDRPLNEAKEGDILVMRNAGAYGFEMSSTFNSRLRPAEVLVLNGKAHLIRKRDTHADLLKNQVEIPELVNDKVEA